MKNTSAVSLAAGSCGHRINVIELLWHIQNLRKGMKQTSHSGAAPTANFLGKSKALRYERFDSLKNETVEGKRVVVETDVRFIQSVIELSQVQSSVLEELMGLKDSNLSDKECDEIHFKGRRHCLANILNIHSSISKPDVAREPALKSLYCKCGCERLRGEKYPMDCQLEKIRILGSGTLLFFYMMKALALAIFLWITVFALFALATNLLGTAPITTNSLRTACTSSYCSFRDNASDNYKQNQGLMRPVQLWLGLAAMALWVITSRIVKYVGKIKNEEIDRDLTSASDYAIKIGGLPYGEYNEEELLEYFQKLSEKQAVERHQDTCQKLSKQAIELQVVPIGGAVADASSGMGVLGALAGERLVERIIDDRPLGIKSVQIIYNMEFSRKMIAKITGLAVEIKSLVKQKGSRFLVVDKDLYHARKNDLVETYEVFEDLRKKFLNDSKFRKALSTRVAIIEFAEQGDKTKFLEAYGKEAMTFFKQIKEKLLDKCFGENSTIVFKGSIPEIVRAPEPSDVIWENCEKRESLCRMLLIYFITFVLIMVSLGIMVGLEYGQSVLAPTPATTTATPAAKDAQGESVSTLVNIVVSIVMQVINAALWASLSVLLELEYNHTFTNKIVSQMTKTSVAMWINIIILPIIVNYTINNRYYGSDGLAGIVFDYHISTIAVGLTVKLLDPMSLLVFLGTNIKCIRNYLIKARYRNPKRQGEVDEEAMRNVYRLYEAPEFNIAEAYTYILSNVLHAAFFCELQPFLVVLALVEAVGFYWVCKFKVVKWCKIPNMTERLIFDVALSLFSLVPIFYGVGSIFNSYIAASIDPSARAFSFVPSAICVGIGLLNYFNPKNSVQRFVEYFVIRCSCCFRTDPEDELGSGVASDIVRKNVRLDTYYKSTNSLSLLGFENVLLGKLNMGEISEELKNYCESHIRTDRDSEEHTVSENSEKEFDRDTELKEMAAETNAHF